LRDDGTFWLNIGDSYAASWGNYGGQNPDVGNSVKSRAEVRHTRGHMMG
jgi:hypothetical protein